MFICPNCRGRLSRDAQACPRCHADLSATDGWRPERHTRRDMLPEAKEEERPSFDQELVVLAPGSAMFCAIFAFYGEPASVALSALSAGFAVAGLVPRYLSPWPPSDDKTFVSICKLAWIVLLACALYQADV